MCLFLEKRAGASPPSDLRADPTTLVIRLKAFQSRVISQLRLSRGREGGLAPAFPLQPHSFFCSALNLSTISSCCACRPSSTIRLPPTTTSLIAVLDREKTIAESRSSGEAPAIDGSSRSTVKKSAGSARFKTAAGRVDTLGAVNCCAFK